MHLHYWASARGNFGDDLNLWLWDGLLPGWRDWDPTVTLVGVGTILNAAQLDRDGRQRYLVMGSGQGNGPAPDFTRNAWDIRAVRGPRSARALGAPADLAVTDPAVMIATFPEFAGVPASDRPLVIPHISSLTRHDWAQAAVAAECDFVSPEDDAHAVIARIAGAPLVLAESMHAAILADAFRVPWIAISLSPQFDGVKWLDWAESLGLDLKVRPLFPEVGRLMRALGRTAPVRTTHAAAAHPAPAPGRLPPAPPGTRTAAELTAAGSGGAHGTHARPPGRVQKLRLAYEAPRLAARLRQAAQSAPQLSPEGRLSAAQEKFARLCMAVRRDYG